MRSKQAYVGSSYSFKCFHVISTRYKSFIYDGNFKSTSIKDCVQPLSKLEPSSNRMKCHPFGLTEIVSYNGSLRALTSQSPTEYPPVSYTSTRL